MKNEKLMRKILSCIIAVNIMGLAGYAAANNSGGMKDSTPDGVPLYTGVNDAKGNTVIYDGLDEQYEYACGGYNKIKGSTEHVEGNSLEIRGDLEAAIGGNATVSIYTSAINNTVTLIDGKIGDYLYGGSSNKDALSNTVIIKGGSVAYEIIGGKGNDRVANNTVEINSSITTARIYAGYNDSNYNNNTIEGNKVVLNNGTIESTIYAGYIETKEHIYGNTFQNNTITVTGDTVLDNAELYGTNADSPDKMGTGNNFIIDGWNGTVKSVNNFNGIDFKNLKWQNGGTVLEIGNAASSSLANTDINLISIASGQEINAGEYMYIIQSDGMLDTGKDKITVEQDFTVGVTIDGTGEVITDDNGNVKFEVTGTSVNDQINLVAENRAVAAAFINQGTDLIADSLDVLSRDGKHGIKTFAAVHGNRSKYDVNSDLKINGWSSIVGVGNEKNIGSGDFSWGVFYENGSGNYRTYNKFNNEFFRGDGSLVYNGGGIAARFEQDNGIYTEGSLRAGMLKSEMSNALKDANDNSYGYKSESTYYGAHIGAGKIISLNEATDLDVYSKFFHTYTDGDSFEVAGDKFEFDSITSDRLRIGARLTTNKENKFSTYYGLAYEYEFNGDAQMRAQNMSTPEQSLQGSSCMAEIGMNYKPGSESPWSFDLSMRGYAGQRDGFSGNVQATYCF